MIRSLCSSLCMLGLLVGCHQSKPAEEKPMPVAEKPMAAPEQPKSMGEMHSQMAPTPAGLTAIAMIHAAKAATTMPSNNDVNGTVTFTQVGNSVKVIADIKGLAPNTTHGFHIHDKGDLSAADLMSAGGHFNPGHHPHGGPTTSPVHEGDLGNLTADADGNAHYEITVNTISVGSGAKNDVVGHSVIIHAKSDDYSTQPTGNSGGRVAGGVIELQK